LLPANTDHEIPLPPWRDSVGAIRMPSQYQHDCFRLAATYNHAIRSGAVIEPSCC
jgi:hypothetical protein